MRYCAYFCEENVWHLCRDDEVARAGRPVPLEERRVVFISNEVRSVTMRHQRAGRGGLVHWDYHVVLLAGPAPWTVWDPDNTRALETPVGAWLDESFPPSPFPPRFRVIEARRFLDVFSTDRSHMLDDEGLPQQPFPSWDPPQAAGRAMNLMRFVDMTAPFEGEVLDLSQMRARFCSQ
jgi:hypothetical protein